MWRILLQRPVPAPQRRRYWPLIMGFAVGIALAAFAVRFLLRSLQAMDAETLAEDFDGGTERPEVEQSGELEAG
jgi:hypothetical protein